MCMHHTVYNAIFQVNGQPEVTVFWRMGRALLGIHVTRAGHMKAVNMWYHSAPYITQATFGDSKIKWHGTCGQYGNNIGKLYIVSCCQN